MSTPTMLVSAETSPIMPYSNVTQQLPKYTLYRGSGPGACYASSPFVTKVELRMRLSRISYKVDCGAPWLGPKGKIPYLHVSTSSADGSVDNTEDPKVLGDSTLIIKYLVEREGVKDLNETLDPADKARDLALRALLEDKLYFYHMRECWIDNYYAQRDQALSGVPYPVRFFVGQVVYKKVVRTLFGQGAGRYTKSEVEAFRDEIWKSINELLSATWRDDSGTINHEPFWCLGGNGPTEADITLFGFISAILGSKSCPSSSALIRSLPAVMEYASLIHRKYFPEYIQWQIDEKIPAAEVVAVLANL